MTVYLYVSQQPAAKKKKIYFPLGKNQHCGDILDSREKTGQMTNHPPHANNTRIKYSRNMMNLVKHLRPKHGMALKNV